MGGIFVQFAEIFFFISFLLLLYSEPITIHAVHMKKGIT